LWANFFFEQNKFLRIFFVEQKFVTFFNLNFFEILYFLENNIYKEAFTGPAQQDRWRGIAACGIPARTCAANWCTPLSRDWK
jgi:hypothetical protein